MMYCYLSHFSSSDLSVTAFSMPQSNGLKKFNSEIMFTALFILSIAVFGYLVYVLVKPEKF